MVSSRNIFGIAYLVVRLFFDHEHYTSVSLSEKFEIIVWRSLLFNELQLA